MVFRLQNKRQALLIKKKIKKNIETEKNVLFILLCVQRCPAADVFTRSTTLRVSTEGVTERNAEAVKWEVTGAIEGRSSAIYSKDLDHSK